ncbi:MAG: sulfatase-like hydrolase/transferase, partial [Clostridiales bacterium]|nr:sulfatase-like hydrolase/transferase [Clostridiales bacterium]
IVFVLDRLDYDYVEQIRKDDPAFFDRLDGFTEFTDATSPYLRTFPSAAFITTGVPGYYDKPRKQFLNEAWGNSDFIRLLKDNNYTTKYHMTPGYAYSSIAQLSGIADNIVHDQAKANWFSSLETFFKLSRYRYAPLCLKPGFWLPDASFLRGMEKFSYVVDDDPAFFRMLTENGLTVQENKNNYMYIHLEGSHAPYVMDENSLRAKTRTDVVRQTKGAFNIVFEYIDKMKELGLYENATIIITADHGAPVDDGHLAHTPTIGLFIKPSGSEGTPLKQNNAQVSLENLLPAILQSEGLDHTPFGISAFDVPEDAEIVRPFYNLVNPSKTKGSKHVVEYFEIRGHSRQIENWHKISEAKALY